VISASVVCYLYGKYALLSQVRFARCTVPLFLDVAAHSGVFLVFPINPIHSDSVSLHEHVVRIDLCEFSTHDASVPQLNFGCVFVSLSLQCFALLVVLFSNP